MNGRLGEFYTVRLLQVVLEPTVTSMGSKAPPTSAEAPPSYMVLSSLKRCSCSVSSSAILFVVVSLMVEKSFRMRFSFKSETSLERASAARTYMYVWSSS